MHSVLQAVDNHSRVVRGIADRETDSLTVGREVGSEDRSAGGEQFVRLGSDGAGQKERVALGEDNVAAVGGPAGVVSCKIADSFGSSGGEWQGP